MENVVENKKSSGGYYAFDTKIECRNCGQIYNHVVQCGVPLTKRELISTKCFHCGYPEITAYVSEADFSSHFEEDPETPHYIKAHFHRNENDAKVRYWPLTCNCGRTISVTQFRQYYSTTIERNALSITEYILSAILPTTVKESIFAGSNYYKKIVKYLKEKQDRGEFAERYKSSWIVFSPKLKEEE